MDKDEFSFDLRGGQGQWFTYTFVVNMMKALWCAMEEAPDLRTWEKFPMVRYYLHDRHTVGEEFKDPLVGSLIKVMERIPDGRS